MKSFDSPKTLQWSVNLGTAGVLGLVLWYVHESREFSGHRKLSAAHTQNGFALGQVLEQAALYSQKDPSVIPLLNQIVGRASPPSSPAASTAVPAAPTPNRR